MTLDELTTAHTPAHRAVGPAYVRAGCACGWTGCMCAYPAELRGEHRDHVPASRPRASTGLGEVVKTLARVSVLSPVAHPGGLT